MSAGADSRRSRVKAPAKQLESRSLWKQEAEFVYKGKRVRCRKVQDGRYWSWNGFLDRSPDQVMDRIDGKPLAVIMGLQ